MNKNGSLNIIKYPGLLLVLIFTVAMLTGCNTGSTVDTVLRINPNLSGTRIMNVTLDDNAFKSNFSGDISKLEELIEANIPECMEWEVSKPEEQETADGKPVKADPNSKTVYSFSINFDSKEDYEEKIHSILGPDATMNMEVPGNVWSFGVYVYESYTSHDLLEWLIQAIVDEGLVTTANSGYILGNGSNTVTFGQYSYEAENYIEVDSISNLPIDDITILLEVKPLRFCDVTVIFDIPKETMDAKGTSIETYMNRMNTDEVTVSKDADETVRYTINATEVSFEKITDILEVVFGDGHAAASLVKEADQQFSPLEENYCFDIAVDYINFLGKVNETTITRFLVKIPDSYMMFDAEDLDNLKRLGISDSAYPDYIILYDDCGNSYEKTMLLYHAYEISRLNVNFKNSGLDWVKESIFTLEDSLEPEEAEIIRTKFLDRGRYQKSKINVQCSLNSEGKQSVYISETGKTNEIVESSAVLFNGEKSDIYYMSERKAMKSVRAYGFLGEFDYQEVAKSCSEDFEFICKITLLGKIKLTNQQADAIQSIKGNTAVFKYSEPVASIQISGEKYDKRTIAIYIMLSIGILCIICGTVSVLINQNKKS